ncbi:MULTISPECIES: hypothetical protein [unclassified Streptomyces]|uniref:hypothetical protein n=1 Tax=unclassified Streptomyces TaxID=2593676 RepID=UPI0030143BD1
MNDNDDLLLIEELSADLQYAPAAGICICICWKGGPGQTPTDTAESASPGAGS